MNNINVDVKVEVNLKEVNARLDKLLSEEGKKQLEEIKKLSPEEQLKWSYETIDRVERKYREYLKGRGYIE